MNKQCLIYPDEESVCPYESLYLVSKVKQEDFCWFSDVLVLQVHSMQW